MSEYVTHNLFVKGNAGGELKVVILENTKTVMTTCSCSGTQKCIHVSICLSGIVNRVSPQSQDEQRLLIERLKQTKEGQDTIASSIKRVENARLDYQPFERILSLFSKKRKPK
jgi:hypothetical protein